jgi:D-sedoheptulose 7-phosphate isomerase
MSVARHAIVVPSSVTARIQEMHVLVIHLLCERIDDWASGRGP